MFGDPIQLQNIEISTSLKDCCEINPLKPKTISDETEVSFIPMQDVSENCNSLNNFQIKKYSEVKKGYTFCAPGDILFAKITPCMENGKGAELKNLKNNLGFGSTEFHVLRPKKDIILSKWLYFLTKLDVFRKEAAKHMTGTGGQKRVPTSFLENFKLKIPSLVLQEQFVAIAEQADKSEFDDFKSQFIEMFSGMYNSTIECTFSLIRNGANIKQDKSNSGYPITRIETISNEYIDRSKMGYGGIIDNKYEDYYLHNGDILMSHINSIKHIGKCALYLSKGIEKIIHGMNLLCLRPSEAILPIYALHMLRSKSVKDQIIKITKPAVNQASFTISDFKKIKIPLPSINIQKQFVTIAEQADKSEYHYLN